MPYREQALLLGPQRSLVGIMCTPSQNTTVRSPTIVILNSGIIHRVGANRMHVELARALARLGYPVLRFDLSGIGDSLPRTDTRPVLDGVMDDVRIVLDQVTLMRGDTTFVLVGLCSGAMHSLLYAADDARVKGLILLDLLIPHTMLYWLQHARRRALNPAAWRHLVSGRFNVMRRAAAVARMADDPQPAEKYPSKEIREALEVRFNKLVERNAKTLAVFTDGLEGQHNYRTQLLHSLSSVDFNDTLTLEYFHGADHTFSSDESRVRLACTVIDWLSDTFGSPDSEPATMSGVGASANSSYDDDDADDREDLSI